jgi:predicted thioredoxin/glutaredoxin
MIRIEVIGLEPPCKKCNELLENAKKAALDAGVEAEVIKLWTLSEDVRRKYGLLLSPALAIEGVVVAQGKVYKPERIAGLLQGA